MARFRRFSSTNERLSVASDSASNLQSLVNMLITMSYSIDITLSGKPVTRLSIFTVSALCVRMKSVVSSQPTRKALIASGAVSIRWFEAKSVPDAMLPS